MSHHNIVVGAKGPSEGAMVIGGASVADVVDDCAMLMSIKDELDNRLIQMCREKVGFPFGKLAAIGLPNGRRARGPLGGKCRGREGWVSVRTMESNVGSNLGRDVGKANVKVNVIFSVVGADVAWYSVGRQAVSA